MLPIAIPALPFIDDMTLITSSGAEVPNATTVSPITRSVMPQLLASDEAPSVRKLAPPRISMVPPIRISMSINIS
jgi:hypothetical protein